MAELIGVVGQNKNGLIKAGNLYLFRIPQGKAIKFSYGSGGWLVQDNRLGMLIYLNAFSYSIRAYILKSFASVSTIKIYKEKENDNIYNCYITSDFVSSDSEAEVSILDFNQKNTFNVVDVTDEQISNFTEIL